MCESSRDTPGHEDIEADRDGLNSRHGILGRGNVPRYQPRWFVAM